MRARTAGRRPSSIRRAAPRRRDLSCLIAAVLASGAAVEHAAAREVPFDEGSALSSSAYNAISVSSADIDGDGDLDALGATLFGDEIVWYENTASDGSAWSAHTISTTADGAQSIRGVDIDEDGDLDVLVAERDDAFVGWYENTNGDGSVWAVHTITSSANGPKDAVSADVDGDGDIDALAVLSDDSLEWYENTSNDGSTWTTHVIAPVLTHDFPFSADAADMDGDGDIDMLFTARSEGLVAWYENNNGDGSSWSIHTITTTAAGAASAVASDVDGDGDLDVFSAAFDDNTIAWHENTSADGSTWTTHNISTTVNGAISVFVADIDGDGDPDVATSAYHGDRFDWHENVTGDGSSWNLHTVTTDFNLAKGASFLHAADLDGDGDFDLLSAGSNSDTFAWFRNDTIHRSAVLPQESVISTSFFLPISVFGADVDGDGDVDTLSASFLDNKIAWSENTNGDGSTWSPHTITSSAIQATSVFAADMDGDADVDALSASNYDNKIAWYENTAGDGSSWSIHTITTSADGARSVFAADVNGDGDTDALSASYRDKTIAWYENTSGDGSTWSPHTITNVEDAWSVFAADVDGDGDVDALSASRDGYIAWIENTNGDGSTWSLHTIANNGRGARSVFAADVDGDGDIDALSAYRFDDKIVWYENAAGDGSSWSIHTITTSADGALSVFAADVDGDGDADALSASSVDNTITWYENTNGDGSFWSIHTITTNADGAYSVFAADMDGDGDLDALSASGHDNKIAWHENRGGQFGLPTLSTAQKIVNNASTHDLLDIEAVHRGRTGDSDAELVTLELKLTDGSGTDLTSTDANNLIEELRIHLDDGSGEFDGAPTDAVVHTVSGFTLTNGVETITFDDGNANAQLPFGSPKIYFAVADLTADADSQTPSAFQLTHLTESSSTGEDAAHDIPLTLEFWPDTGTGVVDTTLDSTNCEAPFDLLLSNRNVTTTVVCQAGTFIRAGTNFTVDSGGDLSLSAGETIRFTSGFHLDTGTLTVTIDPTLKP